MMFRDKSILYIVHNYNSFQKDPIEETAKYFKKVYVLVRYKPISNIVKYFPIKWLKKYDDSKVIDLRDLPDNVEVLKTPIWYWPYGLLYRFLGEAHFKAVEKVIKKNNIKFDIIHCHFLWSSGYVGMKLKEKYNIPFVVTGHGFDVYKLPFKNNWWRNNIKNILEHADKILTVSQKNRKCLLKLSIEESKISVIGNGYNSRLFYPLEKGKVRKELGIDKSKKILLSIGNLEVVKGHKYLIEAVNRLKKTFPDILCYIIGEGSLHKELEELIKSNNLDEKMFLLGHMQHQDLNRWINACDVFVLPSLSEGLPIVMLEAIGSGKPFVGSNVGGIAEVITSSQYGFLVKPLNSEKLAEALYRAFNTEFSGEEIYKYSSKYTIEKLVRKIFKFYDKLLD